MQKEANSSDNQMHKITKNLRLHFGRTVIEPGLIDSITLSKRIFNSFFNADFYHFEEAEGKTVARPFVYCSDYTGFIYQVAAIRNINLNDLCIKIGLDSGKGHLKMILSVYDQQ